MAQNIYDDPAFFAGYSEFPRSREGLSGTSEWPALRALLPPLAHKRIVDLGCGFGQFTRYAAEQGAASVLGIDLSEKMLARARAETPQVSVTYHRTDLDTLELAQDSADLVFSSMALHYVADFPRIVGIIAGALAAGGDFVFSVEHPIFAARAEPGFAATADGRRAWLVADYAVEGERVTDWITPGIVKYHRRTATMLNTLRATGFDYVAMDEWAPSADELAAHPDWRDELIRPTFLLIAVKKPELRPH
jgi:SAM-dependent methyltransferase